MEDTRGTLEIASDETLQKEDTGQNDSFGGKKEGCDNESDNDNWQREMADDDESAELNDEMSDDDGDEEPPRNRQRMTM